MAAALTDIPDGFEVESVASDIPAGFEVDTASTDIPDGFEIEPPDSQPEVKSGWIENAKQIGKNIATVIAPEISVALNPAKSLSEVLPKTYEAATAPAQIVPKLQDSETAANITRVLGAPGGIGVLEAAIGPEKFQAYSKAAINSGVDMANFLTSPVGASTLGLGALPAAVQKGASAAFMGAGMVHFPEAVDQWKNAKTDEEKAAAGINLLNLGAQIVLPALHLAGRPATGGVTEGQTRAPGLPQEVLDRATTQNQLQALAPESVPLSRDVQPITPQAADGLHLAREKWVEELKSAPPEKQARLQVEIDDIDAQLLEADRQIVGESRARVSERGQSKPQESTLTSVDTATGGPRAESATSKLFAQARSEVTPEVIAQAIEKDAEVITRELDSVVGDTLPPELPYQGGPGAMGPVEAAEMRPQSTGVKNAQVEAERIARGEDPMTKEEPLPNRQAIAEAVQANAKEPGKPLAIIEKINNSTRDTRDISVADQASVMAYKRELMNERTSQENILADGNRAPEEHIVARRELDTIEQKMNAVDQATETMGTEGGRFLQLRQRMIREDFSLDAMERKARIAKADPEGLNAVEKARIKEQSERIQSLEKELADTQTKIQEQQSTKAIDEAVSAIRKQAEQSTSPETRFAPRVLALAESIVARLEGAATAARERIRERMSRASAGVDPTVVYDVAVIGVSKLARASLDFAKWSAEMKADLGDWVEPYLKDAWKQTETLWKQEENRLAQDDKPRVKKVRQRNLDEGQKQQGLEATIAQSAENGAPIGELASPVQKLALSLVRSGITDREMLIDRVHQTLQKAYPDVTRSQARDLISGYGEFKPLDKEAAKTTLRGLKGEMQQLGKIEDMQAKIPPKKTGIERREPTDAERQLIKEVNQLKQMGGFKVTNPETQLKSALQSYKTRTANRIADLQDKLKRGDFSKPPKRDLKLDAEASALQTKIEKVKEDYNKALRQYQLDQRDVSRKVWDGIQMTRGALVNIASSFDFSAPRQALFSILSNTGRLLVPVRVGFNESGKLRPEFINPITSAKNLVNPFPKMFKAWASDAKARDIDRQIKARPNAKSGADKLAGIEYSDLQTNKFNKYEENAHSILDEWAELPLRTGNTALTAITAPVKLGSRAIRMSNRAFITFLNSTRATLFDTLMELNFKDRTPTLEEIKHIGNMVNLATGRGKMSPKTSSVASEFLWAPKLLASRLQLASGMAFKGGSARTKAIIAEEYARAIGTGFLLYTVGQLFSDKKETDPTSSDFGKIVRGNVRVDPWGGFQQVTTLASRAVRGERKTGTENVQDIGADRKFGTPGMFYITADFLRSKLRPDVAAAVDIVDRKAFGGKPTDPAKMARDLLIPLPLREIDSILKARGWKEGMILQALGQFGAGIQVYDEATPNKEAQK